MLENNREFIETGAAVHRLHNRDKRPIGKGWQTAKRASYAELRRNFKVGENLGVRLGEPSKIEGMYLHAIDLDIRDDTFRREAVAALIELFPKNLLQRMPTVMSGSGGASRHYYFLAEEPLYSRKLAHSKEFVWVWDESRGRDVKSWKWEIELFGTGKQTVLPPSIHPITGKPYKWLIEIDVDLGIPVVPMEILSEFFQDSIERRKSGSEPVDMSLEEAAQHLGEIQDLSIDRWTWTLTGMSVKYDFGEDGWVLFDAWSQKLHGEKYDPVENRKQWDSYKNDHRNPRTFQSVIWEVKNRRIAAEFGAGDDDDDVPVDDDDGGEIDEVTGVPKELLSIPGVLQMIADYYKAISLTDQPQFAIQAALAFASIILGRNFCTDYGKPNYASLYFICVGDTGSGKETVKDTIEDVLRAANLDEAFMGPGDYTSEGGLMSKLMRRPKHITVLDEFGKKLGDDRKGYGATHKDAVYTAYLTLFSKLHSVFQGTAYSENGKTKEEAEEIDKRRIVRPALTLVGLTPPSVFYSAVSSTDVSSGFLNRFLVVQSKSDPFQAQRVFIEPVDPPKEAVDWAIKYARGSEGEDEMMLSLDPQALAEPVVVPFSKAAKEMLGDIEAGRIGLLREYSEYGLQELFSRTREIIHRVALIIALSDQKEKIEVSHLKWAWKYVGYYHRQTAEEFRRNAGRPELRKIADELAEYVKTFKEKGITEGRLSNNRNQYGNLPDRDKSQVKSYLRDLYGIIEHRSHKGSHRFIHPKYISKGK